MAEASRFEGFPEEAFELYEGLEADNSKAYWEAHREVYERAVRAPVLALLAELEPEVGRGKLFRPNRDVRFSADKSPYKTHAGAVVQDDDAGDGALYLQVSADGLLLAGGYWRTTKDQVARYREAVAHDGTGPALVRVLRALERDGWEVGGEQLVRVPKPWLPDHPRADLLRRKSLTASLAPEPGEWLSTRECLDVVREGFRALAPLNRWLRRHVGPPQAPA